MKRRRLYIGEVSLLYKTVATVSYDEAISQISAIMSSANTAVIIGESPLHDTICATRI